MADRQLKTPVAFIIFNRPDTTARVFEEIRRARPPKLLVVADGPRLNRPGEAEKVAATRAIVEQVDWPCQVLKNYAETNLGCKQRVSSGLDWVFQTVEEAIILEDDCLPHPTFFRFCEELLEKYRDDERVMMIAGTNYLLKIDIPESYLFSRYFAIWGWASWRRAWQKYDLHLTDWETLKAQKHIHYFYPQRYVAEYFTWAFDIAYRGQIDTWDIQWFYSCLFNNGLSVVPHVNLISNIGIEGTHTENTKGHPNFCMPTFELDIEHLRHPSQVFANAAYDHALFERNIKVPFPGRIQRKITDIGLKLSARMTETKR